MKNLFNLKTLLSVAIISLSLTSCTDDDYQKEIEATPELTKGTADFSNYVAIGNSLTAGFTDGALFMKGQENSTPNILAGNFANIGGGAFTQPMMADNNGGLLIGGTMIQNPRLYFNGTGPAPVSDAPTTDITNISAGPFNNMGVPGAKSFHLGFSGYGNIAGVGTYANPYFVRMASTPAATMIGDAVAQNPTFFSLWIGANDVLTYSLGGGTGTNQTGNYDPTTYASNDITDPVVFDNTYNGLADALTANGSKGVVLNIPYVKDTPYFTTVPYNPVPLDQATADQLNGAFATYNGALASFEAATLITTEEKEARTIHFVAGLNAVTIVDEYLTDLSAYGLPQMYRQATADDLLILTSRTFIGTQVGGNPLLINGVSVPLDDQWVLSKDEIMEVNTATDAYNTTIEAVANNKGLAFVNANALMTQLANGGIVFDEFNLSNRYIFGEAFSLDGAHLTARGSAFIANEILKAIDTKYGSNFEASGNLNKAKDFVTQFPAIIQ